MCTLGCISQHWRTIVVPRMPVLAPRNSCAGNTAAGTDADLATCIAWSCALAERANFTPLFCCQCATWPCAVACAAAADVHGCFPGLWRVWVPVRQLGQAQAPVPGHSDSGCVHVGQSGCTILLGYGDAARCDWFWCSRADPHHRTAQH